MIYNKLVRDRIPEMIEAQGETPSIRILDDREYLQYLEKKLDEEVEEFHADQTVEELADILEVVYALVEATGYTKAQLLETYEIKHKVRGSFQDRIFLISKEG